LAEVKSLSSVTAPGRQQPWHEILGSDLLIRVRVQPRASREGIDGAHDGRLKVRVSAPPVEGAANARVVLLLAEQLGVPRSTLTLTRGAKSRDKDILVQGVAARAPELIARLIKLATN
jgi:uncharacterized protein (TIGR00251 family)